MAQPAAHGAHSSAEEEVDDDYYNNAPPPPQVDLRDWASPEQLFEMRRLNEQMRSHLQAENTELRTHLTQAVKERDSLAAELQHAHRQLDAIRGQRAEAEKMKARHAEWSEERAMLVLRLQQLSNEVAKLRTNGGGAGGPGSTSAVSASTPSTTFRGAQPTAVGGTNASSSSTGTASAAAFLSPLHAALVEEMRSEVVAGIEAQGRLQLQLYEADRRAEFQAVVHSMEIRRMELRCAAAATEVSRVLQAVRDAKDTAATERGARIAAEAQVSQLTSKLHAAMLQVDNLTSSAAAATHEANDDHSDEIDHLEAQIEALKREHDAAATQHRQAIADVQQQHIDAVRRIDASRVSSEHDAQRRIAALEDELHEQRREQVSLVTRLHDEAAQARQEAAVSLAEIDRLRRSCKDFSATVQQLTARYDEAIAAKNDVSAEAERLVADYGRLRTQYDTLVAETATLVNVRADRDLLARHLAAAQEELKVTNAAVERSLREAAIASEILQRHAASDTALAKKAADEARSDAAREAVRRRRADAERAVLKDKLDAFLIGDAASKAVGAQPQPNVVPVTPPSPPKLDLLELLRSNAEAAANLRRSINGGRAPPPAAHRRD